VLHHSPCLWPSALGIAVLQVRSRLTSGLHLQILVELAELQDQEVGDGTTSVVIVAAELLKRANELVRNKIHPTSIISGYRLAMREVCRHIAHA
jgi:chaperonin GroEL (HSP60 family)